MTLNAPSVLAADRSPLLTATVHAQFLRALSAGAATTRCSLDLERSQTEVELGTSNWSHRGHTYPYLDTCKERTIYFWDGESFRPVARYASSLIKLVPTQWGAPTFEIDGIKMLPTAQVSPYDDAQRKVALIQPRDKTILDTCGGLGYFGAWCLRGDARHIVSYEKNSDVLWLRSLNPWSPEGGGAANGRLRLELGEVDQRIGELASASFDAVLHDPPRFGIAGELYSQAFYDELARVLKRKGKLFHYTGSPNKLTTGRDVPREVANRLGRAGFSTEMKLDGVLAIKRA
jgi:predicted methyltransferase